MSAAGKFTAMSWPLSVASLALVGALTPMQSLRAGDTEEIDSAQTARLQQAGEILTSEQITQRARAEQPGEITETELKRKDGQYVYEVDVVDDQGIKRELTFGAKTGEYLASEEDDEDGDNDDADNDEN